MSYGRKVGYYEEFEKNFDGGCSVGNVG